VQHIQHKAGHGEASSNRGAHAVALPIELTQSFLNGLDGAGNDLRRAARAITRNSHDADDLVQETMLRAIRFADSFKRGTNLTAWLRTILRNTAINQFRRTKRRPSAFATEDGQDLLAQVEARAPSPLQVAAEEFEDHADAFSEPVRDAVRALPDKYRRVFLLSALGGYKYREIAERVGIPVGTVMSRLHRARHALQQRLVATD
jgi:RNA polymerase sigma-70 factor (ECF subfamily)